MDRNLEHQKQSRVYISKMFSHLDLTLEVMLMTESIHYYKSTLHSLLHMDVILLSIQLLRLPSFESVMHSAHLLLGQYILVMVYFKGQRKEEITQKKCFIF